MSLLRLMSRLLFCTGALLFVSAANAAAVADATATRIVRAHTTFLSDDLTEGRGAGTRGYQIADRYVAAQFARLGLQPAGDDDTF